MTATPTDRERASLAHYAALIEAFNAELDGPPGGPPPRTAFLPAEVRASLFATWAIQAWREGLMTIHSAVPPLPPGPAPTGAPTDGKGGGKQPDLAGAGPMVSQAGTPATPPPQTAGAPGKGPPTCPEDKTPMAPSKVGKAGSWYCPKRPCRWRVDPKGHAYEAR